MAIPESDRVRLTPAEVHAALAAQELHDWELLAGVLHARYATGSFAAGVALVAAVGAAADAADHHPDLDLSYPRVLVRLSSHDVGGITARDLRLARTISELAAAQGARPERAAVQALELSLDTDDLDVVAPFWAALLGYRASGDELVDPAGRGPVVWFQQRDPADRGSGEGRRQAWHPDVWVPADQVASRVEAALAAGGRLVSDAEAPSYIVLADPEGNRVCLCTSQGRGPQAG
ncbi:4a-hydroxytetrahydrobiopterin dehydratase [Nocardioides sp.]|uniref:4a-hydroxytetrahydrobiopterin dehydratase n=1 Tax=Nocardioides sp. TaxID=35761 RepID=UPI0035156242